MAPGDSMNPDNVTRRIRLIFQSEADADLFRNRMLPALNAIDLTVETETPHRPGYPRSSGTRLKQDVSSWHVLSLLISGGTLGILIKNIRDIVIKYLEISRTSVILEINNTKLSMDFKDAKQLREVLSDAALQRLLVSEDQIEE